MAFNQTLTENIETGQLFDVSYKNVNTHTINGQSYPNNPTVIAVVPVWQAGSLTTFVSGASAVSPWSSNANIDTGAYNEGAYVVAASIPDQYFNIAYNFGSRQKGYYQLTFSYRANISACVIGVNETNTLLSIGSIDAWTPNTGGTNVFATCILYFNWAYTGNMNIEFNSLIHNPNSTGYNLSLVGNMILTKIS